MAFAPSQSAAAEFNRRDVFVTEGALVFKIDANTHAVTLFAALGGCLAADHNGITFDHFGTFGFDMIVTCQEGNVFRVHGDGTSTHIAGPFGVDIEGPAVVPPGFGPHGGEIWVADEDGNAVHAVRNDGTVFPNILSHVNPEGVFVIPSPPCTFCGNAFYQAEQQLTQLVFSYPLSDFTMLGGNVIITSEAGLLGADTSLVTVSGGNYVQSSFGPRVPGVNEGASFVDCDVPTPSPTPTATFTPTPTPTPSATFTPTPTPTPTVTPGVCPLTQGFWKTHPEAWPVHSLTLGTQIYNMTQLLAILNTPDHGDASIILAKQLIAAKLNIAAGSDPTPIAGTIATADGLLDGCVLPCNVKPSSTLGMQMTAAAAILDNYNNGLLTPGCPEGGSQSAGATSAHQASPKGKSKLKRLLHPFRK